MVTKKNAQNFCGLRDFVKAFPKKVKKWPFFDPYFVICKNGHF